MKLTAVMTHPIQYYSPWFRYIHTSCPEIALTVVYATLPTASQQGVGFGTAFEWDGSPLDGYRWVSVRESLPSDNVHSDRFFGLDVPAISERVRESSPDVLLVPGWNSMSLVRAAVTGRRMGIPVIYRGDSQLGARRAPTSELLWSVRTRSLLRLFRAFLSVGSRNAAYLRHFGIPDSRIFFAPHSVDNEFFSAAASALEDRESRQRAREQLAIASDDFVVLFVGKLEAKKRPWQLIEAAVKLGIGATVLIAGTGPEEDRCRRDAARLGVRTFFCGFVNQSRLGEVYAVADVLVLPSDFGETWGLVVNEAMASGLPCVVSSAVGCGPDLVKPGETGFVYPLDDVPSLVASLEHLRADLRAGKDYSASCRATVAGFSVEAATAGLLDAARSVYSKA